MQNDHQKVSSNISRIAWVLIALCGLSTYLIVPAFQSFASAQEKIIIRITDKDGKEKVIEALEGSQIQLERPGSGVVARYAVEKLPPAKVSADVKKPFPLKLREVVSGRLGNSSRTGKFHYWLVDLPAGKYKLVLDVTRADDRDSSIGGFLTKYSLEGEKQSQLGAIIEIDRRYRRVFNLVLEKPWKGIIRYENRETISDYQLGIFPKSEIVSGLFFKNPPKIVSLELGKTQTTTKLDGNSTLKRDSYFGIRLPAGDYKIVANFQRVDRKKGSLGGLVKAYDADGSLVRQIIAVFEIDVSILRTGRLSLAEEKMIFFRVSARNSRQTVEFSVKTLSED